jgi:hypothetical protein
VSVPVRARRLARVILFEPVSGGFVRIEDFLTLAFTWDNCIVFSRPGSPRKSRLKVVDWEFAVLGNPCWDIGSVFSEYLNFWLLSIPVMGEAPPDQFLDLAPVSAREDATGDVLFLEVLRSSEETRYSGIESMATTFA